MGWLPDILLRIRCEWPNEFGPTIVFYPLDMGRV